MKKLIGVVFILVAAPFALADSEGMLDLSEASSIDEYLAQDEQKEMYEYLSTSGDLDELKEDYLNSCSDEEKEIEGFCACFTKNFKGLSDREIIFSLIYMGDLQEKMIQAMRAGDSEAQTSVLEALSLIPLGTIEAKCAGKSEN